MKRTPLKRKIKGMSKAQKDYRRRNPKCRICGKTDIHIHHINRNRKDDSDDNLESLCWRHHTSPKGVHSLGNKRFCELYFLTNDSKWIKVYGIAKRRN